MRLVERRERTEPLQPVEHGRVDAARRNEGVAAVDHPVADRSHRAPGKTAGSPLEEPGQEVGVGEVAGRGPVLLGQQAALGVADRNAGDRPMASIFPPPSSFGSPPTPSP